MINEQSSIHPRLLKWFQRKRWNPFPFQLEAWQTYLSGHDGLVNAPTGTGKTYSVWMGPLSEWMTAHPAPTPESAPAIVLWITPLRALANDTLQALSAPVKALKIPWTLEIRTGDTSSSTKSRQRRRLPTVLVTTPESLSVLLSYEESVEQFASLQCVIVDEWHELMGSKRGTQTELCIARLRALAPGMRTWGLSATLGNLDQAMDVLVGDSSRPATLIRSPLEKRIDITTLLPTAMEKFPWSGHLGLRMLDGVLDAIEKANSTLVFTNTRSQTEIWFAAILRERPKWRKKIALHHGSLDRDLRVNVENMLRAGKLKAVVCTSSLDLGVDFSPVDQVIQIGSPKGIARMLQRAGRSGHQPDALSRILGVPTNSFELIEFAAVRTALEKRDVESRLPLDRPLDVLVQHMVTLSLGHGFEPESLLKEIRKTYAYRHLSKEEFQWALDFITHGGSALSAYSQYQKVAKVDNRYKITGPKLAHLHRMNIGTITSDMSINLLLPGTGLLGSVEESFVSKMKTGDRFVFAGRLLEFVRMKDASATVRLSRHTKGTIVTWGGSRAPFSSQLGVAVRAQLGKASEGTYVGPEMQHVRPILEIQKRWSILPSPGQLLIESVKSREGYHLFVYPMEGYYIHEGLGNLIAWRLAQDVPATLQTTVNDYGFEILSNKLLMPTEQGWRKLFTPDSLLEDMLQAVNAGEMSRRHFREVARIAGLVFGGYPGAAKSGRQVQSSSSLIFDVFQRYDPENLLLEQAQREVMERQLEVKRLADLLHRLRDTQLVITKPTRFTPMAFPLWASRIGSSKISISSEPFHEQISSMAYTLEEMAASEEAVWS